MISKDNFLKNFSNEEREIATKVYDSMSLAYNKEISCFSKDFLTPNIWTTILDVLENKNISVEAFGGYDICDRRIVSFNNFYDIEYPYKFIKIKNNSKFSTLSHRDYLGAIMALGIQREKMGDLRVIDDYAVIPVYEDLAQYIVDNLQSVGKSPVNVEIADNNDIPASKFEEMVINISSTRIDNYVSKLANVSRGKALDLIDGGKVLVNYTKVKGKSQDIVSGDNITIGGIGKFIVDDIVGNTKSGRFKINVKKYI